jgi:hypothetical protein
MKYVGCMSAVYSAPYLFWTHKGTVRAETPVNRHLYTRRLLDHGLLRSPFVDERRSRAGDRRRASMSGRRTSDPTPDVAGARVKTSATTVWELPDLTRCWVLRHRGRFVITVSRGMEELRQRECDSEADALRMANDWQLEFAALI